ncbi:DUF2059 domain-containing protein [uncultured Pseudoteredinibacter sp.]|uniref:DUF2059 domain-containing protein n=1 Tax=uncultured Pseudoteredinibacter sp. TaxID=1641701 RepID=UPI002627A1D0|nr:DUF2059 domain-containing protein [uncultured Pseudoteredinibacter sp.]
MKWLVVLLCLSSVLLHAEENTGDTEIDKYDDLMLALELAKIIHSPQTHEEMIKQIVDDTIKGAPHMEPFRKVFQEFYSEYVHYDFVVEDVALIYSELFDKDDLLELKKFHTSEVGQKFNKNASAIQMSMLEANMERMANNMQYLQPMLEEEAARLKSLSEAN